MHLHALESFAIGGVDARSPARTDAALFHVGARSNGRAAPSHGTAIAPPGTVDVLPIVERCVAIERGADEIYQRIAARFQKEPGIRDFWLALAADEREHAHKLSVWGSLLELQPKARHPDAAGFEQDLLDLEKLVRESRNEAERVQTLDDGFAIALALESSELDVVYTTLLQSSPIKRFPDVEETRRDELGRHHQALVREIRARSKSEKNRYEAELIAARA